MNPAKTSMHTWARASHTVIQRARVVETDALGEVQQLADESQARRALSAGMRGATGLPDTLAQGVEALSGLSMDGVRVQYDSPLPAQLGAHAFAQGTEIHLGPGQAEHLPHEAWHVVQQMQGRVTPTVQRKGIAINDNSALEREADVMGAQAAQVGQQAPKAGAVQTPATANAAPVQRVAQGAKQGAKQGAVQFDGEGEATAPPGFDAALTAALRLRGDARRDAVVAAIEGATAAEVEALAGDRSRMRRIQGRVGGVAMRRVRGAMARVLHANGQSEAALRLLISRNRRVQRAQIEAFGTVTEQRALEEAALRATQDDALAKTAFELYWGVRLSQARGRIDRDGSGGRRPERMRTQWTADRLRTVHDQLRRLPEQDVRIDPLRSIRLLAGEGGGWYSASSRRFGLGADASNTGITVHHLAAAAARRARSITLDDVTHLSSGVTIRLNGGGNNESAAIRDIDAATRVVRLQHRLLNGYPEGATVVRDGGVASVRARGGHLTADVAAGATTLPVDSAVAFSVGDEIVIDDDDQRTLELRTVTAVEIYDDDLTITPALARPHVRNSTVRRSNLSAVTHQLSAAAAVGDTQLTLGTVGRLQVGGQYLLARGQSSEERITISAIDQAAKTITIGALTQAHPAGVALERAPATAAGSGYTIATETTADTTTITLNSVAGIVARDRLVLDAGQATEERTAVVSVDAANNRLTLNGRLVYRHAAGANVAFDRVADHPQLTAAVTAGATRLTLTTVNNLHVGDTLIIAPRQQLEERADIQSIDSATRTVTLATPLTQAHAADVLVIRNVALRGERPGDQPWLDAVVRHEIAHALDEHLGASLRAFKRDVAGWREDTSFDDWANAMGQPWQTRSGATISAADKRRIKRHITRRMRGSGGTELNQGLNARHPIQRYWSEDVPVIEAAKMTRHGQTFWQTPISIKIFNNTAFAINHYYHHFQRCKAETHQQRVRDYSSFSAAEFFAEVYTVFYEEAGQNPAPTPGRLLPVAAWRDWMTTHVHNRGHTPAAASGRGTTPTVGMGAGNPGRT